MTLQIDGPVSLSDSSNQVLRFESAGWAVIEIDGHDPKAIDLAIIQAKNQNKPTMIACKTHIALGHAAQDTSKGHGALTDDKQIADAKAAYGWTTNLFEIPADVKSAWLDIGLRGKEERKAWETRFSSLPSAKQKQFNRVIAGDMPKKFSVTLKAFKKGYI